MARTAAGSPSSPARAPSWPWQTSAFHRPAARPSLWSANRAAASPRSPGPSADFSRRPPASILFKGQPLPRLVRHARAEQRRQIQYIFQNPDASLNPRARIGQTLARPLELFFDLEGRDLSRARGAALSETRLDSELCRALSRSAFGRRAPAGRHRPRPDRGAGPAALRRSPLGPRRLGPGQYPGAAARLARAPPGGDAVHRP